MRKMKKQIVLSVTTLLLVLLSSCKTENDPKSEKVVPNYMPLAVGNYWVYQNYRVDSLGNERLINQIDSVVITKDTIVNNKKYYVFEGSKYQMVFPRLVRDSLGYLVSNKGEVLLSSTNYSDTISTKKYLGIIENGKEVIFGMLKTRMDSTLKTISVPAGKFDAITCHGTLKIFYYDSNGNNNQIMYVDQNAYFAANIGKIIDTYYYYSNVKLKLRDEIRLIRYKIN
jgi:hypothetical protein